MPTEAAPLRAQKAAEFLERVSVAVLLSGGILPMAAGQAPEGDPPPWSIEDGSGDVAIKGPATVPVPSTPLTQLVDLKGLDLYGEDESGLWAEIRVGAFEEGTVLSGTSRRVEYLVAFRLAEAAIEYQILATAWGGVPAGPPRPEGLPTVPSVDGHLCVQVVEGGCGLRLELDVEIRDEADAFRFWLPKSGLLGRSGAGMLLEPDLQGTPARLSPGDTLHDVSVEATLEPPSAAGPAPTRLSDRVPDAGPAPEPFVFTRLTANVNVAAAVRHGAARLPYVPEAEISVPFTVWNHGPAKRVIRLEYRTDPPSEPQEFNVTGPGAIAIPAHQSRNLSLALRAGPLDPAAEPIRLLVEGRSAGAPDEIALARARLVPGFALAPGAPRLHLHAWPLAPTQTAADGALCGLPAGASCTVGFLSPDAEERDAVPDGSLRPEGAAPPGIWASTRSPLADAALINGTAPIAVQTTLRAAAPLSGVRLEVRLAHRPAEGAGGGESFFRAEAQANLDSAGTAVVFHATAHAGGGTNDTEIPAGHDIRFELVVLGEATGLAAGATKALELLTASSHIELPVRGPPTGALVAAGPRMLVTVAGDGDEFVNPGEGRLFNVTVANGGDLGRRVRVETELQANPGWNVHLLPGDAFDLAPDDSITVGVLVRAPSTAAEGEIALVQVTVRSDDGASAAVRLRATAIQYDVADDTGRALADEDASARLVAPPGRSRTPGAGVALAGLAAMAATRLLAPRRGPPRTPLSESGHL